MFDIMFLCNGVTPPTLNLPDPKALGDDKVSMLTHIHLHYTHKPLSKIK